MLILPSTLRGTIRLSRERLLLLYRLNALYLLNALHLLTGVEDKLENKIK